MFGRGGGIRFITGSKKTGKLGTVKPTPKLGTLRIKTGATRQRGTLRFITGAKTRTKGKSTTRRKDGTLKGTARLANIGLTELAEKVFGEEAVRLVKDNGYNARDIWEMTSPTVQCNNTVGRVEYGKTKCWICGLTIKNEAGFKAECEHVLPIAQASIFISLYNPRKNPEESRNYIALEYGWAHNVCNQEKGAMSGVLYHDGVIHVDKRAIEKLLAKIFKSKRSQKFTQALHSEFPNLDNFKQERVGLISEKYSAIINAFTQNDEKFTDLFILAGYATLEHTDTINPKLQSLLLNREALKESLQSLNQEKVKSIREFLGLSQTEKQITKKTDVIIKLEEAVLRRIEKNIVNYIGSYRSGLRNLSEHTHSLEFLQSVFLKFGDLKDITKTTRMIVVTSDFLTIEYFKMILEKIKDNTRFGKVQGIVNKSIVELNDSIAKSGIDLEELTKEYEKFSSEQPDISEEILRSFERSASKGMSVEPNVEQEVEQDVKEIASAIRMLKGEMSLNRSGVSPSLPKDT